MFSTAHHTSHHSEPWPSLKVLGFPGEMTKPEAHLQPLKGSKLIQTWWDAEGSTTRDAICIENPTSCYLVRKYYGRTWDKRPDPPYFCRRSKGNEALKKEHFLAGAELQAKPMEDPEHICSDHRFSALVCSTIHVPFSPTHIGSCPNRSPSYSCMNWQLRIRRK